jgi:UDP-N-acetylglucosamine acyltransferase
MLYGANTKKGVVIDSILNYKHLGKNCQIHHTAVIEEGAKIGNNVTIGAYCVIGKKVQLGDNCFLKSHVVIEGQTQVGKNNHFSSFAVIGQDHQDLKYAFKNERIIIGDNNRIKEHVTVHPGTIGGGGITIVGDNNLLMVGAHIAHDCIIGDNCILANNATLGGHVEIGDYAIIGGLSAVHQFVRIGKHAMVGGMTGVEFDVIPFGTVTGNRAKLEGLNLVGMKRRNMKAITVLLPKVLQILKASIKKVKS